MSSVPTDIIVAHSSTEFSDSSSTKGRTAVQTEGGFAHLLTTHKQAFLSHLLPSMCIGGGEIVTPVDTPHTCSGDRWCVLGRAK